MFFSSKTIDALVSDHKKIRSKILSLRNIDAPMAERRNAFELLVPILVSHTEREESVIHDFMKKSPVSKLRLKALDGEEEHHIVGRLVDELSDTDVPNELWSSKARVLESLITAHVDHEEKVVFPELKRILNEKLDDELCERYEEFDTAFSPRVRQYEATLQR